jgi:arginase family enzyme
VDKGYDDSLKEFDVRWHTIKREGIEVITHRALDRTSTDNVYITVDLDALTGRYVHTDWGNGRMSLDQLLDAIALVKEEKNIIGLDVTGTDGTDKSQRTAYTIASIVNEVTDGPYDRRFFHDRIKKASGSDRWNAVKEFFS